MAVFNCGTNCILWPFLSTLITLFNHKGILLSQLPVASILPQLFTLIADGCQQIILKAAPGAGKSTYFPLRLLQQGGVSGRILLLEPRRLAAKTIANYIANQLGEAVGQSVGYRIKGESRISSETRLEIVTEGILTRIIQSDPELNGISMIIFDEFHERTIHADTGLAFALEVQGSLRHDLQLIIMSATLDLVALNALLPNASYVESDGRSYPVTYRYAPLKRNDIMSVILMKQIMKVLLEEEGSVLVFLPGMALIKQLGSLLVDLPSDVDVFPLYGQLALHQQQIAIDPPKMGRRKVVLTTNVAETSLTIEGIRIVIDSGLEKVSVFDNKTGMTRLEQQRISRSSADQRAGRAGRLDSGICVRLYSETQYQQQPMVPEPEIVRSDLTHLAFELSQWGVVEPTELCWLNVPPSALLSQAYDLLDVLGLVDQKRRMTSRGHQAYQLVSSPRLSAMLIHARAMDIRWICSACAAVSLIEDPERNVRNLLLSLHSWKEGRYPKCRQLEKRAHHLSSLMNIPFSIKEVDSDKVACLFAVAYPDRVGQIRENSSNYVLSNGHGVQTFSEDVFSQYIVTPMVMRHHSMNSQIELAVDIDIENLQRAFGFLFHRQEWIQWDEKQGKLVAEERVCLGHLIIERKTLPSPSEEKMTEALLNYVRRKGLSILHWQKQDSIFIERVACAQQWLPKYHWKNMDESSLLSDLDNWLAPFMYDVTNVKALQKIVLIDALRAYLGWELCQVLDRELPVQYQVPSGTKKSIHYHQNSEPMLAVRIQEVFGMTTSPTIAMGTKTLILELLSPAQRPIQITRDLNAFWQGSYKEVQKEMKGRYPKHPWPDDPENHIATTKTKRQLNS